MLRYERKATGGLLHLNTKKQVRFAPSGQRVAGERSGYTSCAGWQALHVAIDAHSRVYERLIWHFCACSFGGLGGLVCTSNSPGKPRVNNLLGDHGQAVDDALFQ